MNSNLKPVLDQIEKEKGIPREELFSMLESALTSAFKKHATERDLNYSAHIDNETGEIKVFIEKNVVKKVSDPGKEVDKVSAMKINPAIRIGDNIKIEVPADKFGRIAAQTAKQIIMQKMRENERESIYRNYIDKEGSIITGTVYRFTRNACILEIDKAEAILPVREQIKNQYLQRGNTLKVYIVEVNKGSRGAKILVSRTHPGLVAKLFNLEVPEIADNVVEIIKIVRDPGTRCKVAVISHNPRVDPIGACVGINGVRVQSVISELEGERMDLIKYSDDIKEYLSNSLSPAEVKEVIIIDEDKHEARLVVSEDMLSLAIGKNGQNVRLAARLTNWHLDIQSETQMKEIKKLEIDKQKAEQDFLNILDLPGVGEKTARLLCDNGHNNLEKIKKSGIAGLTSIPGVGKKTAEKILYEVNSHLKKESTNDQ